MVLQSSDKFKFEDSMEGTLATRPAYTDISDISYNSEYPVRPHRLCPPLQGHDNE